MFARLGRAGTRCRFSARGDSWVLARVARRTYRRRLGFAQYDIALSPEGQILEVNRGWMWVGRGELPMCDILGEGWIPRPGRLPPSGP